jgi:DNA primase
LPRQAPAQFFCLYQKPNEAHAELGMTNFLTIYFFIMKVSEKSNGAVQGTEERREETINIVSQNPKSAGKNSGQEKPKEESPKAESPQNGQSGAEVKEEKPQEPAKEETKPAEKIQQPALNLESTLKVVNDLHRRCIQRENLLTRINELEAFEINLIEEGDELESNHFQGCKLMIVDDKNRQFITSTSGLIKLVAQFIHNACLSKLGEIEADIVFPRP